MENQKERSGFNRWSKHNPDIPESELQGLWRLTESYKSGYQPNVEGGLSRLKDRMAANETGRVVSMQSNRRRWMGIAAAIALLLVCGLSIRSLLGDSTQTIVNLMDAPKEVTLEDGSMVVLNKNSRLEYPKSFSGQLKREVLLHGEAYFDVSHNPAQPFVIRTEHAEVKVVGTSFNVRAYENEPITEVEVESGHVRFRVNNASRDMDLRANQKAIYQHDRQQVMKEEVESLTSLAWKTNTLEFRKTPMKNVVKAVSRYYHIQLTLEDDYLEDCLFNSNFDNEELSVVLDALAEAFNAEIVEQKANEVYMIRGGECE